MEFIINKASDFEYEEKKVFNTLEELIGFMEEAGEIILSKENYGYGEFNRIVIYDDYVE